MASSQQRKRAKQIIAASATAAAGVSGTLAQGASFGADAGPLTAIHVGMIHSLGELFGQKLSKQAATAILGTAVGAGVGISLVKAALGLFPGLGNIANASISSAYTVALGYWCFNYFDEGRYSKSA